MKMGPESFQWCPVTEQGQRAQTRALEQAAQKVCGASLEDTQNPPGRGSAQHALDELVLAGVLD